MGIPKINILVKEAKGLLKSNDLLSTCEAIPKKLFSETSHSFVSSPLSDLFIKESTPIVHDISTAISIIPTKFGNFSQEANTKFAEFLEIIQKRNPEKVLEQKHIEQFAKSFFDNSNYTKEDEIIRYLNRFIEIASKKTPQGEDLMSSQVCRWFADIRGNGLGQQKIKEFRALIECAERGLVPKSALRNFNIATGVNPNILADLEKLKFAEANGLKPIDVFIPEFDSMRYDYDKIANLKSGDMFSIKGGAEPGLYIKNSDGTYFSRTKLNINDRETLFKLLPPVKRYYIEQHGSGTCYQLGAYISYLSNPSFMRYLLKSIESTKNGELMIKMPECSTSNNMFAGLFEDFSKHGAVSTKLEGLNFKATDESQSVISNPLIKALEYLYGKYRKYTYADQWVRQVGQNGQDSVQQAKAFEYAKQNMDKVIYVKDSLGKYKVKSLDDINRELLASGEKMQFKSVEDYYKNKGGTINELFKFLNHNLNPVAGDYRNIGYLWNKGSCSPENLQKVRNAFQIPNTIKMFGTIPKGAKAENVLNQSKNIISSHGYSILDYNPTTDIVRYINPHDSAIVYDMKLTDLMQYVNTFSLCRV